MGGIPEGTVCDPETGLNWWLEKTDQCGWSTGSRKLDCDDSTQVTWRRRREELVRGGNNVCRITLVASASPSITRRAESASRLQTHNSSLCQPPNRKQCAVCGRVGAVILSFDRSHVISTRQTRGECYSTRKDTEHRRSRRLYISLIPSSFHQAPGYRDVLALSVDLWTGTTRYMQDATSGRPLFLGSDPIWQIWGKSGRYRMGRKTIFKSLKLNCKNNAMWSHGFIPTLKIEVLLAILGTTGFRRHGPLPTPMKLQEINGMYICYNASWRCCLRSAQVGLVLSRD